MSAHALHQGASSRVRPSVHLSTLSGVRRCPAVHVAPLPDTDNDGHKDNVQATHADVRAHLEAHTVRELRALCTERGISYNGLRRADLIEVLCG